MDNRTISISLLLMSILFIISCSNEPSLIEQARIQEEQQKAMEALKANQTPSEPKETIPAEFLESCRYNQKIEPYEYRENGNACIDEDGKLEAYIKNIGFDPISSIRITVGTEDHVSEEKDLDPESMRIYRFDSVNLGSIKSLQITPRGKFYDGKIYDCKASMITLSTKDIKECLI